MTGIPGTVGRPGRPLPRAPGKPKRDQSSRLEAISVPPLAVRAVAFLALAMLAAGHWVALVQPTPTGRGFLAALIVTAGGVLIALTGQLPRLPGLALRVLIVVLMTMLAVSAIGIRFKLLLPAGWGTLNDRINGGLSSVGAVAEWPYGGPNVWLRLTTLLAAPLTLVVASAFAFWPRAKEARTAYSGMALGLLVALYAIAVAARPFDQQALRGVALLACLAAWLWMPRLRGRDAAAAATAVGVAALLALVLTPQLASSRPWVDYHHWNWSLRKEKSIGFDWRPAYGPLHWPRKGTTLLLIRSKVPHYWKAESLDKFDGHGWTTTPIAENDPTFANASVADNPKWFATVHVTVRGLKSELVIGPGSILGGFKGLPSSAVILADGAFLLSEHLGSGDSYDVRGYTPDPSAKQMRAAPAVDPFFNRYTALSLPDSTGSVTSVVDVPLRGQPKTGDGDAVRQILRSPYAPMYRLAKRVAGNATTQYDVVRRIGAWLEGHYAYSEKVKSSALPLEDFLFKTKKGYCQHFSGAAALMLRMLGIPVRVASGFAPGSLNSSTHEYVVRDLDAHSWIEVWFSGIGWVPFDPTPAIAPASSQSSSFQPASENISAARGNPKDKLLPKLRDQPNGRASAAGVGSAAKKGGTPWGWIALALVAALLALAAVIVSLMRLRRRRPPPPPCGDPEVDHLVRVLHRLGLEIGPGTTLLELEQRMERLGGSDAAGYARRLRRRRYGDGSEPVPNRADRRRLRQVLAAAVGAGPLTRLHLALPDAALLTPPSQWGQTPSAGSRQ